MPEFKTQGFKDYAQAHPEIGKPTSDEFYFTPDTSMQMAEGGILWYSKANNTTICTPAGVPKV